MKALTICQPYPHLILLPRTNPHHKRVENRTWPLRHRGELVIHAGKSRDWYHPEGLTDYGIREQDMVFGAIVGVARVVNVLHISSLPRLRGTSQEWLCHHPHTEGPYCIVLDRVRRLAKPIPWKGAQGLFDIPDDVIAAAELVEVD